MSSASHSAITRTFASKHVSRYTLLHKSAVSSTRASQTLARSPAGITSRQKAVVCYSQHSFILYTKPDCPLCDGLKDKLQALIDRAQFMPSFLSGSSLEVRDISSNEAWQDDLHLSVPVLAVTDEHGQEAVLPRPPPRISAERLQRHLQEALTAADSSESS